MVAKYMLAILAVCNIAQASYANILDNSKNATADAYGALENLYQASQAVYPRIVEKINRNLVGIKDDLEEFVIDFKKFAKERITHNKEVFSRLQKEAQEKNVDITECLDGKLEEIEGFQLETIKELEECTVYAYKASVEHRDVLREMLDNRYIETSIHFSLLLANRCNNDGCFNRIADEAKKELAEFKQKISGIVRLTEALLRSWRKTSRDCFSWGNYVQRTKKTLEKLTNCATKKMQ